MPKKVDSLSKGGFYYLTYNVLNMAFPFFTGIYVARKILPSDIGLVAAAQNLALYFSILAFLGIPTYGLREIAKTRDNRLARNKLFSELYVINLLSTIVFCSLYFLIISLVSEYRQNFLLYSIAGISIALNAFNISWLYEGLEEFKFISLRNIIFKAFSFGCLVLFVNDSDDILSYAAITVVGTAGNYIVNMLYSPGLATLTFQDLNLRRHMKSILFLVMVNLAIEIYSLIDVTMMNFMSSKDSIAYYKYGSGIQKMLLHVVNTFTMVLVPRISYYFKEGKDKEFNLLVSKGLTLIVISAVPMIVGIYFTSDFLIQQMYGMQYANSATILKIFSMLLLISPIGYLLGSRMLLVTDNENRMIICVGAGAIVNIVGNALLIPKYHELGATITSIISEIVVMAVYISFGKKYFKLIGVGSSTFKVMAAALIMGIYLFVCSKLSFNPWVILVLQIIGAVWVYGIVLVLLKENIFYQYFQMLISKLHRSIDNSWCLFNYINSI